MNARPAIAAAIAAAEFVHGPNLVTEPCQSLLGPRNAEFSSFLHIRQVACAPLNRAVQAAASRLARALQAPR